MLRAILQFRQTYVKPLLVSERLYLTGRDIRAVHKSNPISGIQRDVRGNHVKGVGKIQSVDRLDQVPGYVIHVDAAAARRGTGVGLCHEEKVVHGIKLHISAAEKLLGGAGKRLRKPGLRREIVKLHAEVNLRRGAGGASGGINRQAVHVTQADAGKFSEGARGQINRGYFAGNKWISQSGVTEHCLVRHAIISEARVGSRGKIGVGDFDSRPEGVRGDIGGKHSRPEVAAHVNRPDCIIRSALVSANESNQVISPHRWRPSAGHLI